MGPSSVKVKFCLAHTCRAAFIFYWFRFLTDGPHYRDYTFLSMPLKSVFSKKKPNLTFNYNLFYKSNKYKPTTNLTTDKTMTPNLCD